MQQELAPPAHFLNYPVFCAKLHAFKLFSQIVSTLSTKDNRTIEGRIELLIMALSMNNTTNRSKDRIDLLFSLIGVSDTKDIEFIENTITNITSPITDNNIAGIMDGDGSFYVSFNKNGSGAPRLWRSSVSAACGRDRALAKKKIFF